MGFGGCGWFVFCFELVRDFVIELLYFKYDYNMGVCVVEFFVSFLVRVFVVVGIYCCVNVVVSGCNGSISVCGSFVFY